MDAIGRTVISKTTDEPGRRYYERNGLSVIRTCSDYRKILK